MDRTEGNAALIPPTDLECAVMSKLVYLSEERQGSKTPFDNDQQDLNRYVEYWREQGWEFVEISAGDGGYYGAIYINHRTRHVVLAHRGTQLDNLGAVKTDVVDIVFNRLKTPQLESAIAYLNRMIVPGQLVALKGKLISEKLEDYQLVLTGHSLGAWLAECCAWVSLKKLGLTVHAVTFDSPGSLEMIKKLAHHEEDGLDQLDITNYLAAPNLINTCNIHIGEKRRVVTRFSARDSIFGSTKDWVFYTLHQHAMSDLLRAFDFQSGLPKMDAVRSINHWPHLSLSTTNYGAFFKFAKATNNFDPKRGSFSFTDQWKLSYKAHYECEQFKPNELKLIHIRPKIQKFIKDIQPHKKRFFENLDDETRGQLESLLDCKLEEELGKHKIVFKPGENAFGFYQRLMNLCYRSNLLDKLEKHIECFYSQEHLPTSPLLDALKKNERFLWNMPIHDQAFVGRVDLLKQLQTTSPSTVAITACKGMGGVGKSTLALHYAHTTTTHNFRAWFKAEDFNVLRQDYLRFAKDLGYSGTELVEAQMHVSQILSKYSGWLLIFDNLEDYNAIKDYVPQGAGTILLTSRWAEWPTTFKVLDIDVLPEADAIKLLRIFEPNADEQDLKSLADILGYLPLALAQAGAYVKQNNMVVQSYLSLYQRAAPTLLADSTGLIGQTPVANTWNLTFERLKTTPKGLQALELLKTCAYLAPDAIPKVLLLSACKKSHPSFSEIEPELQLNQLLRLLHDYSLIKLQDKTCSIHRVLQTIVAHQKPLTASDYVSLATICKAEFDRKTNIHEDEARQKGLLAHLQQLRTHYAIEEWRSSKETALQHATLLCDIGIMHCQLGNFRDAKEPFKSALAIQEQHYGKENVAIASTLVNLGTALSNCGDAQEEVKGLYERALKIQELEVAITLENFGTALHACGDTKAKSFYERALVIREQHYDGTEFIRKTLSSLVEGLGSAFGSLVGSFDKRTLVESFNSRAIADFKKYSSMRDTLPRIEALIEHFEKHPDIGIPDDHSTMQRVRAYLLTWLGHGSMQLGQYDESKGYLKRATEELKNLHGCHPEREEYKCLYMIALRYAGRLSEFTRSDFEESLGNLKQSLHIHKGLSGNSSTKDDLVYQLCILDDLGRVLMLYGNDTDSEKQSSLLEESRVTFDKILKELPEEKFRAYKARVGLAELDKMRKDYAKALDLLEEAEKLLKELNSERKAAGKSSFRSVEVYHALADWHLSEDNNDRRKDPSKAQQYINQSLQVIAEVETVSGTSVDRAKASYNHARLLKEENQFSRGLFYLKTCLDIQRRIYREFPDHPELKKSEKLEKTLLAKASL